MKIITDPDLIDYRIGLQTKMYRANTDLCILMQELRDKTQRKYKVTEEELRLLRNKIEELASYFYEMEFGGYYAKKDKKFQDDIINRLTEKYFKCVFDLSIDDIGTFTLIQIYNDMETVLKEEIKAEQNGR